ncbi:hypothetical protein ACFY0N_00650 [Streptomyces vinaceus]|uniref:hypothetical protein n=1 Tax=Streptomyces vinaceus TaxID=1960 RepID=UPI003688CC79
MSIIAGLGTLGVALVLTVLLWLGTGKHAGQGKMPALSWGAVAFLSFCAGSAWSKAGDPLKFSSLTRDAVGMLNDTGQGGTITVTGGALLLLAFVLYKKMSTRATFILVTLLWFLADASGGTLGTVARIAGNITGRFV